VTYFVDRSLGRYDVPRALRRARRSFVVHDDLFDEHTLDTEWLARAGRERWVVLSKDVNLRNPPEVDLVFDLRLHVYVVTNANLRGDVTAELITTLLPSIDRRVDGRRGGYVAGLYRDPPHLRWLARR